MCLSPIRTEKHETAKRLAQRIKTVLDVARSKGFRSGENPDTAIKNAGASPKVKAKPLQLFYHPWTAIAAQAETGLFLDMRQDHHVGSLPLAGWATAIGAQVT